MGEKYDALDEASRAQVDAALDILRSDATAEHNRTLMERLDRIEAAMTAPPVEGPPPVEPPPGPTPPPVPPPPRNGPPSPPPTDPPADPPADPPRRGSWWGDRLHSVGE
jgi:hypothetical protein